MDAAPVISTRILDLLKTVVDGNVEDYSISVGGSNKKGEGYLGEICYVSLKEKTNGKTIDVIVKQAFSSDKLRDSFPIKKLYKNEIHFYTTVWPRFQKFQEEKSVSKPFNKIPKCFITSSEDGYEKLVLENLKCQKFELFDKKKSFDEEHIKVILKEYGKFHAISFAYKLLKPQEYKEITKDLEDPFLDIGNTFMGEHFKQSGLNCLQSLDPQEDAQVLEKLKPYLDNLLEIFTSKLSYNGEYSVVLHGDCWSNNMMFKYNASKELCDMRLLDFQCSKVGTPVFDLSYCIYAGGSKKVYDNLDYYLRVYHDSLLESLGEFGLDSRNIYPFEVLKRDWKEYCQPGFIFGLVLWRHKLTYEDSSKDLMEMQDSEATTMLEGMEYDVPRYNRGVKELILHMFKSGYL